MPATQSNQVSPGSRVQAVLDQLVASLRATLGDQLESIILYGGLARGEFAADRSDVNLMVVLKEVTLSRSFQNRNVLELAKQDRFIWGDW